MVADANIVIAAILRASTVRKLLFTTALDVFVPEYLFGEIAEHRNEFERRTGYDGKAFQTALWLVRRRLRVIAESEFRHLIFETAKAIPDRDDVPYVALASFLDCPLWTNDKRLLENAEIETITTAELIEFLGRNTSRKKP